jgi:hypothetical protein
MNKDKARNSEFEWLGLKEEEDPGYINQGPLVLVWVPNQD